MSYSDDPGTSGLGGVFRRVIDRLGELSQLSWGITVAGVTFTILYFVSGPNLQLTHVLDAPTYVWSRACPESFRSKLEELNIVPCECGNERYRIFDYSSLGIIKSGRGPALFYRIGNDAVQLTRLRDPSECQILTNYRGLYVPAIY
jgi:hypothetical protein